MGPGVLGQLLGPVGPEQFADQWWGHAPLLVRGEDDPARAGHGIAGLFSPEAVDELLTRRGLRAPFLRMAAQGRTLADSEFTTGGGVGAGVSDQVSDDKVRRQFASGSTIVLQGLHRTWGPIIDFSQALAADLGHPVQVNAYITPPGNQGFSAHYDIHDVFVLQVHGAKAWRVHEPVWAAPLRSQPWDTHREAVAEAAAREALIDTDCRPGDVLYLPRGYIHSAATPPSRDVSIHLTVGVHVWTRMHLVDAALDRIRAALAEQPQMRASLPLGVDVSTPRALSDDAAAVREAIALASGHVTASALAGSLFATQRAAQRPAPLPVLAQMDDAHDLNAHTQIAVRRHLLATIEHPPTGEPEDAPARVVVRSRAGRTLVPAQCEPALRKLLGGQAIVVADLDPGEPDVAVEIARTLLVDGIAVAVTPDPTMSRGQPPPEAEVTP